MAKMPTPVRIFLELGHEASIRTKRTPEGFTHDWEVFVRGADGGANDIAHFVDRVVFQLHETFPKPKRVVKEPPFSVKESGYAGFILPIEIYLKNRDEPKKIKFNYDLYLQPSGCSPCKRIRNEHFDFANPSDEFRRKLLKGGGTIINGSNPPHASLDHERNSRDSFTEERPQPLIGKPKLGGDNVKKYKKDYRIDDMPRPSNSFENLFGPTIHKTSRISPDPKKTLPKTTEKKDKVYVEKLKSRADQKEKDQRQEKDAKKDEKSKDEKRKSHKDRDVVKDKGVKRSAEKPVSPIPPAKKPNIHAHSPKRISSPSNKSNSSASSKEEVKPSKHTITDVKTKPQRPSEITSSKIEKKNKKDKKSHEKEREIKKEHKKEKEVKSATLENREKSKEIVKETVPKEVVIVKEKPVKPINKFSIENMLKDPQDVVKFSDSSKHKDKPERERKHKHKKKDKKRDESKEKNKESFSKDKKHKNDKKSENKDTFGISEKSDPSVTNKDIDKNTSTSKVFKEKDRNQLTISPISLDTSSQSSSKSISKNSKQSKNPLDSMIADLSSTSCSDSDNSIMSEADDTPPESTKISKQIKLGHLEPVRNEPIKISQISEIKNEKPISEKIDKAGQFSNHKLPKVKEKPVKQETKEEKKQKKRKSGSKGEDENVNKLSKIIDETDQTSKKRSESSNPPESSQRIKSEQSRSKPDTKVQDDGVSSSLSDNPLKCESPNIEDSHMTESNEISPDYMIQLKELQQRIMTLQSNEELERVVNLIAETGKYEVTKKTFDFDLCLLDRSTVQQLQELIGCESRA